MGGAGLPGCVRGRGAAVILTFVHYSFSLVQHSGTSMGEALAMTLKAASAGCMAAAMLCLGGAWAQDVPPDPALLERLGIMTTRTGLDTANNPLDAIIASLAAACSTEPPLDTRPCPGEKRLLSFLRALSPDQDTIGRVLEALETTCRKEGPRLDCFYERRVHHAGWAWGHDGPVASGDEIYRVTLTVIRQGDQLQFGVDYHLHLLPVPK
jgi:hypothetical protein